MNAGQWIAIYLPIIVLFLIIIPQQKRTKRAAVLIKKRRTRKENPMDLAIFEPYIGKECEIHLLDHVVLGKLLSVEDRWLKVENKKGVEIINSEYVQNIKITTQ